MSQSILAVIGGGNMGAALVGGLLESGAVAAHDVVVVEVVAARREALGSMFPGVRVIDALTSNDRCDAAIVAVKPPDAAAAAAVAVKAGARRVLSIAAGVTLATLERACGSGVAVVRAMPNTPALVGAGASAITGGSDATDVDIAWAESILGSVGIVVRVDESQLDAITGLTGSGPAYLFLVAESLIDAGVNAGLSRDMVEDLVRQLFVGSSQLLAQGRPPSELRAQVTSPNGTTAAGIAVLEARALRAAFDEAVSAATRRSRELGS